MVVFYPGAEGSKLDDPPLVTCCHDQKLRLWDFLQKPPIVKNFHPFDSIVSCATFSPNGKYLAVGLCSAECQFFKIIDTMTFELRHERTEVYKNAKGIYADGRAISGLEFIALPKEKREQTKHGQRFGASRLVVTTLDSRIRMVDVLNGRRDEFTLLCMYKGHKNEKHATNEAHVSDDGSLIVCGSDDGAVYVWKSDSAGPDGKSEAHEHFTAHSVGVTNAIFADRKTVAYVQSVDGRLRSRKDIKHIIITANVEGTIVSYVNRSLE